MTLTWRKPPPGFGRHLLLQARWCRGHGGATPHRLLYGAGRAARGCAGDHIPNRRSSSWAKRFTSRIRN